jgi:hypothetical protein
LVIESIESMQSAILAWKIRSEPIGDVRLLRVDRATELREADHR